MSNRDGFGSGFWLGTLVGGVVGGVIGATIASQKANRLEDEISSGELDEKRPLKSRRLRTADRMELARRSLDDKISDLNSAIDSVRSSIGHPPEEIVNPRLNRPEGDIAEQKPADAES